MFRAALHNLLERVTIVDLTSPAEKMVILANLLPYLKKKKLGISIKHRSY
ncbi:hypothetical protein PanWU01x14_238090 [Parasponia andersonii]|uniref:Uncharacterized protein n=1 Tax=Parasponia andersonii TaxID=3476 RepID=A0A2P5BHL0_PARAD|nr:hypothetical protein PanWU01x14_238090 [Parasponia andersonii]